MDSVNLEEQKTKEGFRITKDRLVDIQYKVNNVSTNLYIIVIPTKELVYGKYMVAQKESVNVALQNIINKEKELKSELINFFNDNQIKYFDLADDMLQALLDNKKIYGESLDGHPLPEGERVIAESVNRFFQRLKIEINTTSTEPLMIN